MEVVAGAEEVVVPVEEPLSLLLTKASAAEPYSEPCGGLVLCRDETIRDVTRTRIGDITHVALVGSCV